ncbi:TauD/TfdA family dioxygenase [Amycolatopsis pithecellobii]|uniref:Taurine catabolism dioxygenase TauD n=1 Tax=Amycolatopsis pithecellobii TaxID=664692 RepID=A0A6N7Z761_9PSEU|nr:TauD/TfdA family dioxygenase [Amycolatopsis pithecellobii]MTD57959.1 taurine catabolism dioxygenase TauD [Amycolatopsis pithecellobii]
MTIDFTRLGEGDGLLVTPATGQASLAEIDQVGLVELLADAGHLLIRGFPASVEDFNALVQRHSSRTTLDPARTFHGSAAQKVDSGHDPIGLHLENGATPFAPDLLWFHCVKAAGSGSQTTVCDGYRVWEALSESTRQLFTAQPITFARNVPAALWRRLAAFLANDGRTPEDMTVESLYQLANPGSQASFVEINEGGDLRYEYAMYAAHPTKWSSRVAWANSILGPSFNYEAPDIRFADGTRIPDDAVAEYTEVTEKLTEEIAWQDGDIVLIDNSRVMHGRRAITDPDRTILNSQSYAKEKVAA